MRHHNGNRKLSRETAGRDALLRGLAASLIKNGRITTTLAKAKEVRPFVEKMVTKAKKGTIADRRILVARLQSEVIVRKLFDDVAPQMKDRLGGYTRITKLTPRTSDQAAIAVIEFV